jgi:hypothetical protein
MTNETFRSCADANDHDFAPAERNGFAIEKCRNCDAWCRDEMRIVRVAPEPE